MTSSILATDKYKLVMALAGAPLRPETFVFMMRRGGPFYLPVDIEAYVRGLLPSWSNEADQWLASQGMRMDAGWCSALTSSVKVRALPRGAWFGDREVIATISGPSALVSWLEPQLIWLQFRIQVATLARLDHEAARQDLAVATCEAEAEIMRELLEDAELSEVRVTADPDGYGAFIHDRALRALAAVDGDSGRVMEAGMRAVSCLDQHRVALAAARDAGFRATSNLLLAQELDMVPSGTTGHEHTQRWGSDYAAFTAVRDRIPGEVTFLLDTYSTRLSGLPVAMSLVAETPDRHFAMRFDSESTMRGDYLLGVSMMQEQGLNASINLGGGFNDQLTRSFEELAEFTGFPKAQQKYMYGQYLVTPHVPLPTRGAVGAVYKLSQTGRRPTMKFSDNLEKSSIPGKPVAFRLQALDGAEKRHLPISIVGQEGEPPPKGYYRLTGADPESVFFDHLSPAVLARFRQPNAVGMSPATAELVASLQAERRQRTAMPEDT